MSFRSSLTCSEEKCRSLGRVPNVRCSSNTLLNSTLAMLPDTELREGSQAGRRSTVSEAIPRSSTARQRIITTLRIGPLVWTSRSY